MDRGDFTGGGSVAGGGEGEVKYIRDTRLVQNLETEQLGTH